jgi:hypothetical protein
MSFRHYLPFDIFSFRRFLPFNVFPVDLLSHSTFCPSTFFFHRRRFLLRHFVGVSKILIYILHTICTDLLTYNQEPDPKINSELWIRLRPKLFLLILDPDPAPDPTTLIWRIMNVYVVHLVKKFVKYYIRSITFCISLYSPS